MKKAILIVILAMLFCVAGCGKTTSFNCIYKVENNLWSAEYRQTASVHQYKIGDTEHYDSESDTLLTVIYKNDISELASAKKIVISYKGAANGGSISRDLYEPLTTNTFTLQGGGKNSALEIKESIIKVDIEVDGINQTLQLKYTG